MWTIHLPGTNWQWVLLATDMLVWIVIAAGAVSLLMALRRPYWRNVCRQVAGNGMAMFSLGWLTVFILIALADSVHCQRIEPDAGKVRSTLDLFCLRIIENPEFSYSSPMAMRRFRPVEQQYPRLVYGGSHLESDEDHTLDVLVKVLIACVGGLGLGALAGVIFIWLVVIARRRWMPDEPPLSKRYRLGTLVFFMLLAVLGSEVIYLSRYYHVLGTDQIGTSILWTALKSIRTAFVIGSLTTFIVTPMAVIFGVLAGFLRGWVDDVVQFAYTTLSSIPNILLISAAMLIVQTKLATEEGEQVADLRLLFLCVVLGVTGWAGLCRLVRGEVMKLREIEYVQAARVLGLGRRAIILRHLVPNVMHIVLIDIVLSFSGLVLAEAVLAYLGIGVHPSTESFGNMIAGAQEQLAQSPVIWWNLFTSFVFLLAIVVPANLFGDAVRDALDPRLRVRI